MNGIGISGTMIRLKANIMAKEMSQSEVAGFSGSTAWLNHFISSQRQNQNFSNVFHGNLRTR